VNFLILLIEASMEDILAGLSAGLTLARYVTLTILAASLLTTRNLRQP
jgi:hypothetical protein